jgi:hypothetical protein
MSVHAIGTIVVTVVLFTATVQAADQSTALPAQRGPAGSEHPGVITGQRQMTPGDELNQTAGPECDGKAQTQGVITKLLNRVLGQPERPDIRLCTEAPELGGEMAPRANEMARP